MATIREVTSRHVPGSLVAPTMSSGVTDSAFFRSRNIPAYGLTPLVITEAEMSSMHGIDERVPVNRFREAVQIYYEIVTKLAGAPTAASVQ